MTPNQRAPVSREHVRHADRAPGKRMTGETPDPRPGDPTDAGPEHGSADGPPRWITVLGVAVAVLVVLMFVFLHLSGAAGPGVH